MQTFRAQCRHVQTHPRAKLVAVEGTDWARDIIEPLRGTLQVYRYPDEIFGSLNTAFRRCPSTGAAATLFRFYRSFISDKKFSRRVMHIILEYEAEFVGIPSVDMGFMERVEAYLWAEAHRRRNFRNLACKVLVREPAYLPHVFMCAHSSVLPPVPDSIRVIWGRV